ncbi:MAG: DUF1553 domain-containing protein [Planctomycetaceae bacterium]|nr:DUF1553 domain-containing protein [Planctomycetaceae bacterium]
MRNLFLTNFPGLICCLLAVSPALADAPPLLFEKDVRPILQAKCAKCHSNTVQKGALDLSSMKGLHKGGESGESALADSVEESMLWIMIDGGGMPPESEPQLTDDEKQTIRQWLGSGAHATDHVERREKQITQHDVLPIVLLRCVTCHGARIQRGGLDLRTPTAMKQGGENGPALIPGDPDQSLMIQRIESEACPPRDQLLKYFVRRPGTAEVETLRQWIAAGAREFEIDPDNNSVSLVTDEDRRHWSFQPYQSSFDRDSIDEFIIAKLKTEELAMSAQADRDTLIRRAYLDLIGMPPSLEEWKHWHHSDDSDWYANMIDELLDSPHYGERWGQYWLDLAGYADSEGGVSADPVRKVAWKYRDYVIDAFNEDKPYDQFLTEQIAGDELLDHENATEVTPQMVDNLIATGFLRMGIDQTGSRTMNFVPERLGVIDGAINVLGSAVMGLTLECARCHSHKYDPLPQRDYYRLKAIFQGAYDEHDWLTFKNRYLYVDTPERRRQVADVNPPLEKQVRSLSRELKQAETALRLELLRQHYPEQSEEDRNETLRALGIADNNRSLSQRILVEKLQTAELIPDEKQPVSVLEARQHVADLQEEIESIQQEMEPSLAIRALWDRGEPSPTYLLRRGEHDRPGPLVSPGVPAVLTDGQTPFEVTPPFPEGTPKSGRRLAFAQWLTQPDHPLTARVLVNRVWYHHFGKGLVKSLQNFGVNGDRPSHPELLDWLAMTFVESGWSIKSLHRTIMNSQTYKQSSRVTEESYRRDPNNRWLSHMPMRRLDAEALRDSLLFVAGRLDQRFGGPPNPISVDRDGLISVKPTADGQWPRSVYVLHRRTQIPSFMATFDYPVMGPNCVSRTVSTVSLQPLMLKNGEHVWELARSLAERVTSQLGESAGDADAVDLVYKLALSRMPDDRERQLGIDTLREFRAEWQDQPDLALITYCHTILNSAEFIYID